MMTGLFMVLIGQLTSPDNLKISITHPDKAPDLVRLLSNKGITQKDNQLRVCPWRQPANPAPTVIFMNSSLPVSCSWPIALR